MNYQLAENDDFYELNEQESGMSTEVHYNGEKYVFSTALQIGIPQTYITLNVTRKFTDPIGKIKASFRYERNKKYASYKQIRNNLKIKPKSFLTELVPLAYWLIMELNEKSQLKVSLLPL